MKQVTAAIIEKNGKILIARRGSGGRHAGMWEFPGGKIEPGETPEECLKRELKEEFTVDAEVGGLFCSTKFKYEHMAVELLVYKICRVSGIFALIDHDEIHWALPEELVAYNFVEADKEVVKKILNGE